MDTHLYVVTRRDLLPEVQAVQSAHAAIDFQHEWPGIANGWHKHNYLVFVSVEDEEGLAALNRKAMKRGLATTAFYEPDLNGSLTAIALEPGEQSRRLCRGLPLTIRG